MIARMIVVGSRGEAHAALAKLRDAGARVDWQSREAHSAAGLVVVQERCPRRTPGLVAAQVEGACAEHRGPAADCYAARPR